MPRALTVTAIIAAYNEEDVIGAVLAELVSQGVSVYLLDHGSTDGTIAEAERFRGRGLLDVERLDGAEFSLARIIRRKELLAAELPGDWFVNADADEFRESPWPGVGFVEALREVDRLGWNAVDFAVLNFPPVHDDYKKGDDPRESFRFYAPGAHYDRLQVRCWKKQRGPLDLVSTAGHEARFADRRVFPLRFLLRHYPIRGQAHGERKVFRERLPRFAADERERGWHVQYEGLREGDSFLREASSLTPYDPWAVRLDVALRHRGVEALETELESCRGELATGAAALARVGDELAASRAALQALERRADDVRRDRNELQRAHERTLTELGEARSELRQRLAEVVMLRQELLTAAEAHARNLGVLRYRLDAVLASRIWRWSAPMRALLDALTRG